jgi:putative tryptophan/tyrosine transport system substrate-binding protein
MAWVPLSTYEFKLIRCAVRELRGEAMRRREFIMLLGGAAAWPLAARGQHAERVRRIGVLLNVTADNPYFQTWVGAFLQGLQQSGWSIGQNVRIDIRWAGGSATEVRKHAAELAAIAPDVILAHGDTTVGPFAAGNAHRADCVYACC